MGRKSDKGVLHKFTYPPYALRAINRTDLMVCGGGGAARTGVPNQLDVLRLHSASSKDGPTVEVLASVDTEPFAVMTMDVLSFDKGFRVYTSQGDHCHEYVGKIDEAGAGGPEEEADETPAGETRQRKKSEAEESSEPEAPGPSRVCLVEPFRKTRTDPSCQNVVRVSAPNALLATGGSDGVVRLFRPAEMKMLLEIEAHASEVADLDISPNGTRLCTVGSDAKDKYAVLWRIMDGTRVVDLALPRPTGGTAYRFKHCRYGRLPGSLRTRVGAKAAAQAEESGGANFALYTTHIPVTRTGPRARPAPCYVTAWDCVKYQPRVVAPVGTDVLCCLAVSDDGCYVGLGSIEGSVAILTAFNLQPIYRLAAAHAIFVTAVEFVPAVGAFRNGNDCELVSVSADNLLRWHNVPTRAQYSFMWPIVGAVLMIYMFFYMLSQLGV